MAGDLDRGKGKNFSTFLCFFTLSAIILLFSDTFRYNIVILISKISDLDDTDPNHAIAGDLGRESVEGRGLVTEDLDQDQGIVDIEGEEVVIEIIIHPGKFLIEYCWVLSMNLKAHHIFPFLSSFNFLI